MERRCFVARMEAGTLIGRVIQSGAFQTEELFDLISLHAHSRLSAPLTRCALFSYCW